MNISGKQLPNNASNNTKENHGRIKSAISEASRAWNREVPGTVKISRDSHYQLANRMAYAWKLASLGYDVILMYLGFIGDTSFEKDYFRNHDHWQRVMGRYLDGQIPLGLPEENWTYFEKGRARMIVRSKAVC